MRNIIACCTLALLLFPHFISGQNIGINQPNPIWPLDIKAPQCVARLISTTTPYGSVLELQNTNTSAQYLGAINFNDPGATFPGQISYSADHKMSFRVGQYERMTIDNDGDIGIGTSNPIHDFEISRPTGHLKKWPTGMAFNALDPDAIACGVIQFNNWANYGGQITDTQDHHMFFAIEGSVPLHLYTNGRAGVNKEPITNNLEVNGNASKSTAGDWLANSDERLKKNIIPLDSKDMLDKLLGLKGISYEWSDDKTGNSRPKGLHYGFTAQNTQEVFPSLVEQDSLGYLQTAYGTYDPMMVESIRALNDKITNLENENAQLIARIEEIERLLSSKE